MIRLPMIINDYINKKIKYMNIVNNLNKVNKGIKIYESNQESYKNPNIKDQINNSKKFTKRLKKVLLELTTIKFALSMDQVLLIYHGCMIKNYIKKLAKMFLLDTIKIKILMNYYLFKPF